MPEPTLDAVADHGLVIGDTVTGTAAESALVWHQLEGLGISEAVVCNELEVEGVAKFIAAWEQLRATVTKAMASS